MKRTRPILGWTAVLCAVAVMLMNAVGAEGLKTVPAEPPAEKRVDNILIDMSRLGETEKPAVLFSHDLHTEALAKQNQDCFSCHLKEKKPQSLISDPALQSEPPERMSVKFKRLQDTTAGEVRRIYHDNCIRCHMDQWEKGVKAGPVVCGECHKEGPLEKSARKPMGFTNSLHFKHSNHFEHSEAAMEKCGLCHHEYDEKGKTLFYAKGKEGSCRYCHREVKEENRVSMATASHLSCVECHRLEKAKSQKAGPVTCGGCHDEREQQKIKKIEPVPRMVRNQPDEVFVKTLLPGEAGEIPRMNPVPFGHRAHEEYNDTCRVCHHESMAACNSCHDLAKPLKEGKGVKLEKAMHQANSEKSCMGCHNLQQRQAKECAGCHVFRKDPVAEQNACLKCHMKAPADSAAPVSNPELQKEAANELLQKRQAVKGTYPAEEIPEKLVMKDLSDKYEQVEFPHRKIVLSLVDRIDGSKKAAKLAAYFHDDKATVCQGCHHHSPESPKPPRCGNCHGKPFDQENLQKPGIMAAYHLQCMGCHEAMGLQKPKECLDCHKERKK